MFMLRNTQRASKRGYAVAASAASLEVSRANDQAQPQTIVFSCVATVRIARWM
jgi:hypothetical protein